MIWSCNLQLLHTSNVKGIQSSIMINETNIHKLNIPHAISDYTPIYANTHITNHHIRIRTVYSPSVPWVVHIHQLLLLIFENPVHLLGQSPCRGRYEIDVSRSKILIGTDCTSNLKYYELCGLGFYSFSIHKQMCR